jgi:hypothetical protein
MAEKQLAEKLKLKSGARALILNAPVGYLRELEPLPAGATLETAIDADYDWIQIFVKNRRELEELVPEVTGALRPESLLWISFPKGSSKIQTDLTRDQGWEPLDGTDLKWINLISVNEVWSAFSLRPYKPGEKRQTFR